MFCPNCGTAIEGEDANFCPRCGYGLNGCDASARGEYVPFPAEPAASYRPDCQMQAPKKNRSVKISAVIIILILFAGIYAGVTAYGNGQPEKTEIQNITEYEYFEISGDFLTERDVLSVALAADDGISFTLNPELASGFASYTWTLFDRDHTFYTNEYLHTLYKGETLRKTEPVLYYLYQKPGVYDVSVVCYSPSGQQTTYSGTVAYCGTVSETYNWTYDGIDYSVQLSFNYEDYLDRKNSAVYRALNSYGNIVTFVTYNEPAIRDLERSLHEAYGVDESTSDGEYASFILSFVQWCFDYPPYSDSMGPDEYQYGEEEYFAYPLETILHGIGDCEDTVILAAALFKAAGFDAGVIVLPAHAVAAVGLGDYSPDNYSDSYLLLKKTIGGVTYYGCETTIDGREFLQAGLVDGSPVNEQGEYDRYGHQYDWYIGKGDCGYYIVP